MIKNRRTFLKASSALAAVSGISRAGGHRFETESDFVSLYDVDRSITNLENAYWNVMSTPVLEEYQRKTVYVNRHNIPFVRGALSQESLPNELLGVRGSVAKLVNVEVDEIALSRCGTESLQDLIAGYNRLQKGDHIVFGDLDYDAMQNTMRFLKERRGVEITSFSLPEPATTNSILESYRDVLSKTPQARLLLVTHLCHRTGLVNPVKEIIALARSHGVACILDVAQSVGQIPVDLRDIDADFAGFSLHKWVGSPLGTGALFIRRNRLDDIDVCLGNREDSVTDVRSRLYPGTYDFAATLTVPFAISLHNQITVLRKQTRLQALRCYWVERVRDLDGMEILTPEDPARYGATTSFRLAGMKTFEQAKQLQEVLLGRYKIMTVARAGITRGAAVRVTPALYNTTSDMDTLVRALKQEHKMFV